MTKLMNQLQKEVDTLHNSGSTNLHDLMDQSNQFLAQLRNLENELQQPEAPTNVDLLEHSSAVWYKRSIGSLKSYNAQIGRFTKSVVNGSKFRINLDDAYTFPLNVECAPDTKAASLPDAIVRLQNRQELMRSVVLHFLKTGHSTAVQPLLADFGLADDIDNEILLQFGTLNGMVARIQDHDLTTALEWLEKKELDKLHEYTLLLFKLHMLQFALLLAGSDDFHIGSAMEAYNYATAHFGRFFKDYMHEIRPVITLLLFKSTDDFGARDFKKLIIQAFACNRDRRHAGESAFIADILECFDNLHANHGLFASVAHEVVARYCADMGLPTESPLFHAVLAGYVNLPNFYKYTQLQRRLGKAVDDTPALDLPFQLPDKNQFLFNFHPIFICPVSKEQLVPITRVDDDGRLVAMANPVVVFDHCRHLALRDSVRQLTKGGSEVFKCHYCYKKHKLLDVSDAYFIDL